MPDLLFVYGTLRSGFDNAAARRLRASAQFADYAHLRGSVTDLGPYTGYRPGSAGEVPGELWRFDETSGILAVLDEYEGSEFERVATETTDGRRAWVYRLL
ncbi:MAG: gamma-glutamylcyclotransferase family protein [Terriglobia bacterium]